MTRVLTAGVVVMLVWTAMARQSASKSAQVATSGELRQWHKITLTVDGPEISEAGTSPNPFLDYRLSCTFVHESGAPAYTVPGYFAGDGNAANSSATLGNKWRVHFAPDKTGRWDWKISFVAGSGVAIDPVAAMNAKAVSPYDGARGSLQVLATNKTGADLRARGRLDYVGQRYLRFSATGDYFLKVGADSPETLLAYADFDGTSAVKPAAPVKTYAPHVRDWAPGDPSWQGGKGKGLIGAINYLASKQVNSISFLSYNAGGDGDNVWPFVTRNDKFHYDVSKLDQWQIVFDHAQRKGMYLHFKLQETENDDNVRGAGGGARGGAAAPVPESLDGGNLGPERKLYLRELIARFGYLLALNWNLGEENTQSSDQQRAMINYIARLDPYRHLIVVHTYPNAQDSVYQPLLGDQSGLTGASMQNMYNVVHARALKWVLASERSGRPWVVANDEEGPADVGVPPDPGYNGFTGKDARGNAAPYSLHEIRKFVLWGTLFAGGAGVEYYFGYQYPENDLVAENFRSRDKSWAYGRIATEFFTSNVNRIPFWDMQNVDELAGNSAHDNSRYAFAKAGELYLVYLPAGGTTDLDLTDAPGSFSLNWFDPRNGGPLKRGAVPSVRGGGPVSLGAPPDNPGEDWLAVVRRTQ